VFRPSHIIHVACVDREKGKKREREIASFPGSTSLGMRLSGRERRKSHVP